MTTATATATAATAAPASDRAGGPRRTSLTAVKSARTAAPRAPFVVLVLGLVGAGLVALLLMNTAVNESSLRLHQLQREEAALDVQEQQLSKDVADLEAPGTLADRARQQGLVPAGTPAFIRVPDGRVLGVPQPAPSPSLLTTAATPSAPTKPAVSKPAVSKPAVSKPAANRSARASKPAVSKPAANRSARASG
jgi:cytoskeletal protein RodZ